MPATPKKLLKRLIALDENGYIRSRETPEAHVELTDIIAQAKELFLTKTQQNTLKKARTQSGWFVRTDIRSQERVIMALVDAGLVERRWRTGGPYEYKAL